MCKNREVTGSVYEVQLEQFSGPFDKLLELIEEKQLDITAVSLSEVTADFLSYVRTFEAIDPAVLADFLVVAARLILIKSKALMPELVLTPDEELEIGNLEERLMLYRNYKKASQNIEALLGKRGYMYRKEYLQGLPAGFYPPENVQIDALWGAITSVFAVLEEYVFEQKTIKMDVIRLEEKIEAVVLHLRERVQVLFHEMNRDKPISEIIVSFLAILMLLKDKILKFEQADTFGHIVLKREDDNL